MRSLLLVLVLLLPLPLIAAPVGVVAGVQFPAWVERNSAREPLGPGVSLEPGDRLTTGTGGRLLLRMAEGGLVKLGERAEFHVERLEQEDGGIFRGIFNVVKGAFRYTTAVVARKTRRNLDIRVSGVTIGIRGTDLWGKAAADRDIVCLIDGQISVRRGGEASIEMSEPLTFYVAPKNKPARPIAPVDAERLRGWAAQTELETGRGITRSEGRWTVFLQSHRHRDAAVRTQRKLRAAGYPVAVERAAVNGATWYRNAIHGFSGLAEARAFVRTLAESRGIKGAWPARH